jgi:beta-galactosidase
MWKKGKNPYDFSMAWDAWHEKDLRDFVMRDRNHPSVMIWSIGNEILEQWDSTGVSIARELAEIVREIDPSRPITAGLNDPQPNNPVIRSGALDLIGFNYHHQDFESFPKKFPGQKFIATETNSGLATRGHYDMPSDSIRSWPERWDKPFLEGNPDFTCSAYDNCRAPWGSTQEETWRIVRKHDFLSGVYIWTGIDYLGEPTPYGWPARSSYFGLADLAGFPKDSYYFYQSEWTNQPILHLFPHWNWVEGDTVDVWAYTNCDEAELFLNGESQGIQSKTDDRLHLMWRLAYQMGVLEAVGMKSGKKVLKTVVKTAGPPAKISISPDRSVISADGRDLSFVTVRIEDLNGITVPGADSLIRFEISGAGTILGTDNGCQTSHESFLSHERKAFNGMCLAVIQSTRKAGEIRLKAVSEGLGESMITLHSK